MFFDEKGKTPIKQYGGGKWFDGWDEAGHPTIYKVPDKQKVKGLLDYFAAKDYHTGKVYYTFYDWKNAYIVVDFFERILGEIPKKTVYAVLDCWSAHRAAVLQAFADMHPRLKLIFLPTNASWMNIIERFFSHVERFVLKNSNFKNAQELMDALSSFVTFGACV